MKLVPVDPANKSHVRFLYRLLRSRPAYARVSDKGKTTKSAHAAFVRAHPYFDWCLIEVGKTGSWWDLRKRWPRFAGATFISMPAKPSVVGDELHVELLSKYQGQGLASEALLCMMERHPRERYVANVAVGNTPSHELFTKLGFTLKQFVYVREAKPALSRTLWGWAR